MQAAVQNLLIDKAVMLDCHRRTLNLSTAWIDVKKAYDSVDHFDSGWYGNTAVCLILFLVRKSSNSALVNLGPLLLTMLSGRPCVTKISISLLLDCIMWTSIHLKYASISPRSTCDLCWVLHHCCVLWIKVYWATPTDGEVLLQELSGILHT